MSEHRKKPTAERWGKRDLERTGQEWLGQDWLDTRKCPPRRRDGKHVLAIGRDEEGVYMVVVHQVIVAEQPLVYPCWRQLPAFPPGMSALAGVLEFSVAAGILEEE